MIYNTVYEGNLSETIRITDRVYQRIGNLPLRDQCNTGILLGETGILLVDLPEQDPEDEIINEVESYFRRSVTGIIFTHGHGDHRKGVSALKKSLPVAISSKACKDEILKYHPNFRPDCWITVDDGEKRNVDGIEICFGVPDKTPAHSPWDMYVQLIKENIVFTGDFIVPVQYLYAHSSNWKNWVEELARFQCRFQKQLLLMGHGYPVNQNQIVPMLGDYLLLLGELADRMSYEQFEVLVSQQGGCFTPEIKKLLEVSDRSTVLRQIKEIQSGK